jgi:hypothetical protein
MLACGIAGGRDSGAYATLARPLGGTRAFAVDAKHTQLRQAISA